MFCSVVELIELCMRSLWNLKKNYVAAMDMRRFGGSGQRADFGSNEDALLFNTLNNALYTVLCPKKCIFVLYCFSAICNHFKLFSDVTQNWNMTPQKNLLIANCNHHSPTTIPWCTEPTHQYAHLVVNTQYYEAPNTSYWSPLHALSVCYVWSAITIIFQKSVF